MQQNSIAAIVHNVDLVKLKQVFCHTVALDVRTSANYECSSIDRVYLSFLIIPLPLGLVTSFAYFLLAHVRIHEHFVVF